MLTLNQKRSELETISFRGQRTLWLEFAYTTKKRGEKNVWSVLSRLIKGYIKESKSGGYRYG